MKKIILFFLLLFSFPVSAQEASDTLGNPSEGFTPPGNIACFDYYKFGSVNADIQTNLRETVPGATLHFSGKIINDNSYPVVDGKLSVKIFKKDSANFSNEDGNPVVDQFTLRENINLTARGEQEVSFEWKVPTNADGGEYYAAYFYTTHDRYNLMGLSFTDDVVGNLASFTVINRTPSQRVTLEKETTTLNEKDHKFAHFPLHFKAEETVMVKSTLRNPTSSEKTVVLQWNQYAWDSQNESNLRNTKTEVITLTPNEVKEVAYEAIPQKDAVAYIVATVQDGESKSILNIRYVRDGVPETRINFPSLTHFPLKEGEENTLFACAHATNENEFVVDGNILLLTLKDQNGEIIHQYRYEGRITAAMSGFGEKFTPQKDFDFVILEAQLFREGSEMENVSITYDCKAFDPNICSNQSEKKDLFLSSTKRIALWVIGGITLLALLVIFIFRKKHNPIVYIFVLTLGTSFLGAPSVEAKTIIHYGHSLGSESWGNGGPYCAPSCGGWAAYIGHVTYGLNAYISGTNTLIPENSTVPANTTIDFRPEYDSTYLYWFSQGGSIDSPYGSWVQNLNSISGQGYGWVHEYPSNSYNHVGSTANLSCNASGSTCTVTSQGRIETNVTYAAAPWKSSFWGNTSTPVSAVGSTPQYIISYPINVSAPTNQSPNAPAITGPNTTTTGTINTFSFQASDPDGDTLRYGIDWDNSGTVDEWLPASGYITSNSVGSQTRNWNTAATYTFRALAQDNQGANSSWANHTITVNQAIPALSTNLTVNGSEGPVSVNQGAVLSISWTSGGATSCTGWGANWSNGGVITLNGSASATASQQDTYTIQCTNGYTTVTDSVQVILNNSLKICQNSCSSGILRGSTTSTGSFTMARNGTQNLVACFNPSGSCDNSTGDVTIDAVWSEQGNSTASLSGSSPKVVTANNVGTESLSATYSGQTASTNVTVTCVPTVSCSNAPNSDNYCENQTFTIDNGCGANITCNGVKTCNYNWKEVSP